MDGTADPPACHGPIPGGLFRMFLSISTLVFVSPTPLSHTLIHADLQGSLSAVELSPGASLSALLRLLLFKFSLKTMANPPEKMQHSRLGACSPPHRFPCVDSTLPSPQPPRCCRGGNSDTALACIAPNKEYQTGMKHKSHLGKNKSSRCIARRAEMGTLPA